MSYHSKYGDSRRSSGGRRDSPPRRRRSPSPGPSRRSPPRQRDPKSLPEAFGRVSELKPDDDLSVIQRMKTSFENSPLHSLYEHYVNNHKVKIWTRNYKEVRGVMTGFIKAFDKHWNILLSDVDEVYLKPKKSKTPFLRDVAPSESLPEIPAKAPKKKNGEKAAPPPPPPPPQPKKEGTEKKKRGKKPKATSEERQAHMLFIRGDNIVLISRAEEDPEQAEEEEEDAPSEGT